MSAANDVERGARGEGSEELRFVIRREQVGEEWGGGSRLSGHRTFGAADKEELVAVGV